MWEDIKRWIVFLYCMTGMVFGIGTANITGTEIHGLKFILYVAVCIFAWLPITIVGFIIDMAKI